MGLFAAILGVVIFAGAAVWLATVAAFVKRSETAIAVATGVETIGARRPGRRSGSSEAFRPTFRFETPGRSVEAAPSGASSTWDFDVGDSIEILYDPAEPAAARPAGFPGTWAGPSILGTIGLGWITVGTGAYVAMKKRAVQTDDP